MQHPDLQVHQVEITEYEVIAKREEKIIMTELSSLTVAEYNSVEQEAISELPNLIVQAYQPVAFYQVGYPTRVRRDSELWKYIDEMHELRFEGDFRDLLGGLTVNEFELLRRLTKLVMRFSETRFKRRSIARPSVLRMLNVFRHIRYLFGDARPRVLEIGPGCGYLGAMLMLEGYPYAATDVSQAFYLHQNHFWNFISDGKVVETVKHGVGHELLAAIPPGSAVHIPWWEFVKLRPESVPEFDVVTCNHCLCEMHPDSLGFALRIARQFLRGQKSPKAFVFEGWGWTGMHSAASVTQRFHGFGFSLVHNDPWITVFAPSGTDSAVDCFPLPAKRMTRIPMRLRNVIRRLAGAAPLVVDTSFEPCDYASSHNPISQAILSGRQSAYGVRTVGIAEVNHFYTDLLGSEDHLSPDEHFWRLAGHPGG